MSHLRCAPALLVLTLLAACACPPPPDQKRIEGENLGSPEAAISYFREAFLNHTAFEYIVCFSRQVRAENPDLEVGKLSFYEDRVKAFMSDKLGDLEDIEVETVAISPTNPRRATVVLSASDGTLQTVYLVREQTATIQWSNGQRGFFDAIEGNVLSRDGGAFQLTLTDPNRPAGTATEIHRIDFSDDWKLDGIEGTNLSEDLRDFIQEQEAEQQAPPTPRS